MVLKSPGRIAKSAPTASPTRKPIGPPIADSAAIPKASEAAESRAECLYPNCQRVIPCYWRDIGAYQLPLMKSRITIIGVATSNPSPTAFIAS